MIFDREIFYIDEGKLADAFNLEQRSFDALVAALELVSDDEQLKESVHFVVQGYIRNQPIRIFSREGAIAIANFLDLRGEATEDSLNQVFALLEQYRLDQIDGKIRRTVYENCSSLLLRNQRHWLSREDVIKILSTNRNTLDRAFQTIQRSDNPMQIDADFENQQEFYFSLSGLEKLSIGLSINLRSKERREYCERVRQVAPPVLEFLALVPAPPDADVERAVRFARKRDGVCQVQRIDRNKYENRLVELVGHHLYDRSTYRFLADDPDNILTVAKQISEDFHQWNGGTQTPCTIDDFIEYVERHYAGNHPLILMLYNRRRVLLIKLSQLQRALPEGE